MQAKERGRWFEWPPRSRSLFPLDARRQQVPINCEPPLLWSAGSWWPRVREHEQKTSPAAVALSGRRIS